MLLYDYFRSSAAFRVRIALALKGLEVERRFVHLLRNGGEQKQRDYLAKNPQGLVPALQLDGGVVLTQSLAIIDYLETIRPEPRLIPADPVLAAQARAAALVIACDVHPLGNLRVGAYLEKKLGQSEGDVLVWRRHWMRLGFEALEKLIRPAPFCFGREPTIADVCLAPQVFNAERFGVDLAPFANIRAAAAACADHPAFRAAHPSAQPDAAGS
ncbi:MAG: maleylacetoacetate isomerase [Methylocystis sp.]|uniref:maleylacetoacetate isomerase n=1 Tax=Methylocystis sp. TaxID=1911079 RepID=UPI003DA2E515